MQVDKERVSITLTQLYLNFLDRVLKDGIYLSRAEAIMASLRLLMKEHPKPEEAED